MVTANRPQPTIDDIRRHAQAAADNDAPLELPPEWAALLAAALAPGPVRAGLCVRCHDAAVDAEPDAREQTLRLDALRAALTGPKTTDRLRRELEGYAGDSGYRMLNRDLHTIGARQVREGVWRPADGAAG